MNIRCPDAEGNGRGMAVGVSTSAYTQYWTHGSLIILRGGKPDAHVDGLEALTEFGALTDHGGVQQYPAAVHRAYFPGALGIDVSGDTPETLDLSESRLEGATFWCEDSDAP